MSLTLKPNESIVTECQLQEFTAILTNSRLVITSPISEENFPLRGISGIGIYDDVEKYKTDLQVAKKKAQTKYLGSATAIGFLIYLLSMMQHEDKLGLVAFFICPAIGFLLSTTKPDVKLQSVLRIMQHGGSRQFNFSKTDANAADIKKFVDQVNQTLD